MLRLALFPVSLTVALAARYVLHGQVREHPAEQWEPGMAEWFATILGEIGEFGRS
jgi:hypothetical protein